MAVLRGLWWALASVSVAFAVSASAKSISDVSLSCAKVGELSASSGAPAQLQCDDPLIQWVGLWPSVWLGVLWVTPPVVAALAMREWVSWTAVAALFVLSLVGLINWTGIIWGQLLDTIPLAIAALVLATVQKVGRPVRGSGSAAPK